MQTLYLPDTPVQTQYFLLTGEFNGEGCTHTPTTPGLGQIQTPRQQLASGTSAVTHDLTPAPGTETVIHLIRANPSQ